MEERRNDAELKVIAERLRNLYEKQEDSENRSEVWRIQFSGKIDSIFDKMNGLPCRERIEGTKSIRLQLKALWAITGGMVLAIISEWVKVK